MEARALLQAAKRGEMEALEELCRLYHPRLCRYAYALTRSREEAEDVRRKRLLHAARPAGLSRRGRGQVRGLAFPHRLQPRLQRSAAQAPRAHSRGL